MEEKELTQWLYGMFDATIPVIEDIENGFLTQNQTMIQQGEAKFVEILSSNLSFAEKIITEGKKNEVDRKFLSLLVPLQEIALAVRSLAAKKKTILMRDVVFSVKAITEITELLALVKTQIRNTRDLILTGNPLLKESIQSGMEKIIEMAGKYTLMHEERLTTGVCMPKASYLYLGIVGSIKKVARELVSFSERI